MMSMTIAGNEKVGVRLVPVFQGLVPSNHKVAILTVQIEEDDACQTPAITFVVTQDEARRIAAVFQETADKIAAETWKEKLP